MTSWKSCDLQLKAEMLRRDEQDLFNVANNFTIHHVNERQKGNYDSALWHSWMFYVNLATIHLIHHVPPVRKNVERHGRLPSGPTAT